MTHADDDRLSTLLDQFRARRERELTVASHFLSTADAAWFTHYVRSRQLIDYTPARKRWLDAAYARQVGWVVRRMCSSERPFRILDAGCGFGTESILFAGLGAQVVGIDLWDRNLRVARGRVGHWEQTYGLDLDLDFQRVNLYRYQPRDPFDVIYAREAVSHIHPIDGFLQVCHEQLRPGGDVVIYDSNAWNPYIQLSVWRARGTHKYTEVIEPETGKPIPYAVERVFSPRQICGHLQRAGFSVVHCVTFGFVPIAAIYPRTYPWLRRLSRWLESLRLARSLGTRYVVVGRK